MLNSKLLDKPDALEANPLIHPLVLNAIGLSSKW